jgi:excisionase family DNA binding protein
MNPPVNNAQLESLWTAVEVAAYLRASRSWVYQHAEDGTLPSMRIGGLLRFEPDAVRRWARGEQRDAKVIPLR